MEFKSIKNLTEEKLKNLVIPILRTTQRNSKCIKLKVACVIFDENLSLVSLGYNGTPSKAPNCCDIKTLENHYAWDEIHAEINAIARSFPPINNERRFLLCSHRPCMSCCQAIAAHKFKLNITDVFYIDEYESDRSPNKQEEFFKLANINFIKLIL